MLAETQDQDSPTPESLVKGIASGNKNDEQKLVQKFWRPLLFILNRRANDPDLASDIAQDTFVVVIKKVRNGDINNPSALAAFIRQTGINLLIAHYRKETRHKTDGIEDIQINIPDQQSEVSDKLNKEQIQKIVEQIMDELPTERDRELLRRYFVYGEDKNLLCSEFDLKKEHFDRVLFRARSRLKQILQVKLNVDTSQVSLSHLLTIGLMALPMLNPLTNINVEYTFFDFTVGENIHTYHFNNNAVTERQRHHLESTQYQRQVR